MSASSWLIYSLLCLILWGVWGFTLKYAYRELPWVYVYFLSSLSSFLIALTIFIYLGGRPEFSGRASYTALLAGVFGGLGYIFFVKALEKGSASIVIPLTAIYPVVTVILSLLFLGEKPSIYQAIGVVLAIAAIVLLSIEET